MATDLLSLSARYIDEGVYEGPGSINRINLEVSEVADGIAVVESFSHVWALRTDDGLAVFDTSTEQLAPMALGALRGWSDDPVHTVVVTHGHRDHIGGVGAFIDDAAARGHRRPAVVGHENVAARLDRYDFTRGYNAIINTRQFGRRGRVGMSAEEPFWPTGLVRPDTTFDHRLGLDVGGVRMELRHGRGETDDHAWAWLPDQRAILAGDFVIWVFPNAGNPQKVQRYPLDWAKALREMAALEPALLLPAHGLPVAGEERIATMLDDMATALEGLVRDTVGLMNEGAALDDIVHTVRVPEHLLAKPYMRPTYDEPDFVVRNIWRLYGGWYDGNPSRLKPPPDASVAAEVAALAGGADRLAARAAELVATDPQLAASLVELAARAAPDDVEVHRVRADVYRACRERASSLMAKGIYGWAAEESSAKVGTDDPTGS